MLPLARVVGVPHHSATLECPPLTPPCIAD